MLGEYDNCWWSLRSSGDTLVSVSASSSNKCAVQDSVEGANKFQPCSGFSSSSKSICSKSVLVYLASLCNTILEHVENVLCMWNILPTDHCVQCTRENTSIWLPSQGATLTIDSGFSLANMLAVQPPVIMLVTIIFNLLVS